MRALKRASRSELQNAGAHTVLAFLLFATFIAHFTAALMHALVYRDGVFPSMASWRTSSSGYLAASTRDT